MRQNDKRPQHLPKCREHERLWRDRCVDKNLKDDWLERLNALKAFELIGICEGHPDGKTHSFRSPPYMGLILKYDLMAILASDWHAYQAKVKEGVDNIFSHPLTSAILEVWYRCAKSDGRSYYDEHVVLRLETLRKRGSRIEEFNRDEWFLSNIQALEDFDNLISDLLVAK